jgi:hypothetical protein
VGNKLAKTNIMTGKICEEHHTELGIYCPYCTLVDYQGEMTRISGMCQTTAESGLLLSERVQLEYVDYQHTIANLQDIRHDLLMANGDIAKRSIEQLERIAELEADNARLHKTIDSIRQQTIAECAEVADDWTNSDNGYEVGVALNIAASIRALGVRNSTEGGIDDI